MSLVRSLFACVRARGGTGSGGGESASAAPLDARSSTLPATAVTPSSSASPATSAAAVLKFGVPLVEVCRPGCCLPAPLRDLLVHVARDAVATTDLFRRPGNPTDMKRIIRCLAEGHPVDWGRYNHWTAANVAKKFLLAIPEGVFGREGEASLLAAGHLADRLARIGAMRE